MSAPDNPQAPAPAGPEKLVVYAVEFASTPHNAHACHRAVRVGEYPDYEAARRGISAFRAGQGTDPAGPTQYAGFSVWPVESPKELPPEMWIDYEA